MNLIEIAQAAVAVTVSLGAAHAMMQLKSALLQYSASLNGEE